MSELEGISIRVPRLDDGMGVFQLIERCPPLDMNSSYCNFLQCSHFASTSVVAERDGNIVGAISGYVLPERPDTLFVWQVAVSEKARGIGLASHMLNHVLARASTRHVHYIETSITEDNLASRALFKRLADSLSAELTVSDWIDKDSHFLGQHDSEPLVRIGPFDSNK